MVSILLSSGREATMTGIFICVVDQPDRGPLFCERSASSSNSAGRKTTIAG